MMDAYVRSPKDSYAMGLVASDESQWHACLTSSAQPHVEDKK